MSTWVIATIAFVLLGVRGRLGPPRAVGRHAGDVLHRRGPARRAGARPPRSRAPRRGGQAARRGRRWRSCCSPTRRGSRLRALRDEFAVPLRLLGIGLPLTIVAGDAASARRPARRQPRSRRCVLADHARLHRRRARPGGRHRRAHPVADPAGAQRRERAQRRDLRAAVLHRARDRRGRRGHVDGARGRAPRARADRLRARRRRRRRRRSAALALRVAARRGSIEPHWLQILTRRSAPRSRRASRPRSAAASSSPPSPAGSSSASLRPRQRRRGRRYLVDEGGELLNAMTFIVFGAVILGPALDELTWAGRALRRAQPDRRPDAAGRARDARAPAPGARRSAFLGWFGPRGLASIVFAVILIDESAAARAHAAARDRGHDRRSRSRARPHGAAADRPLRRAGTRRTRTTRCRRWRRCRLPKSPG